MIEVLSLIIKKNIFKQQRHTFHLRAKLWKIHTMKCNSIKLNGLSQSWNHVWVWNSDCSVKEPECKHFILYHFYLLYHRRENMKIVNKYVLQFRGGTTMCGSAGVFLSKQNSIVGNVILIWADHCQSVYRSWWSRVKY